MGERQFRVTVQYTYRAKKGGVSLGLTVMADNDEDAIDKAISGYVTPYKARVFHAAEAHEIATPPAPATAGLRAITAEQAKEIAEAWAELRPLTRATIRMDDALRAAGLLSEYALKEDV